MKKLSLLLTLILVVSLASTSIFADSDKSKDADNSRSQNIVRPKKPDARSQPRPKMDLRARNRETMLKRQAQRMQAELDKQKKEQEKYIDQLNAIKEMAKKEKAPKTAELISDLIAKEKEEFSKKMEISEKRMKGFNARAKTDSFRNPPLQDTRPADAEKKSSRNPEDSRKSKDSNK